MADLAIGQESEKERQTNDLIVDIALKKLSERGLFQYLPFDTNFFCSAFSSINSKFSVSQSSITTRMARLLFGISQAVQPRNVLVVGSYMANSLVWLATPIMPHARIVGVDIDTKANDIAKRNLSAIMATNVEILAMDGHEAGELFPDGINLLLLDADSLELGKKIYHSLITALEPHINSGAIVLAHDVCYEAFKKDISPYLSFVQNKQHFQVSTTVAIDRFGLEVSRKL